MQEPRFTSDLLESESSRAGFIRASEIPGAVQTAADELLLAAASRILPKDRWASFITTGESEAEAE